MNTITKERVEELKGWTMLLPSEIHRDVDAVLDDHEKARPLLAAVEECYVEDLEYCVGLYGESNPDIDPALDIIRAVLAYKKAKEKK